MKQSAILSTPAFVIALAGTIVSLGLGPSSTAVTKVREGIKRFAAGEFEAAGKAFTEADEAEPENSIIAFNRACALAAAGEDEKARELFQQAALARDIDLAARSHFNLGCLSADQGKTALGDDPVATAPEQREEGISALLTAVGHYRDCLRVDADHEDARHNLELIRLFIKHIQAQWEQHDREKAREEMGLLEFLSMIEQRQTALRSAGRVLGEQPDSPQRRQLIQETADSQTELREEIGPLKEKLDEELQATQAGPQGGGAFTQDPNQAEQSEQMKRLLHQLADEAGALMDKASSEIEAAEFKKADDEQRQVLDRLNQVFMAVAPFPTVLQRATQEQEKLTGTSEELTGWTESDDEAADATNDTETPEVSPDETTREPNGDTEPISSADYPELSWNQSRVTDWSRMLNLRAQADLPGLETQLQAAQAQADQPDPNPPQPPDDKDEQSQPEPPDPTAQLEAMKASLEKAIELAPKIEELSAAAVDHLNAENLPSALPDQQEALKLLREIAEPLSKQNDDQQQDDQQNNDGDQDKQDQRSQQDQQQKQNEQQEQQKKQTGQSPQERAISALRRAREREREHRDLEKQIQALIRGRINVDRDW